MTLERKPDYKQIENCIDQLRTMPWLGTSRSWWPIFLYHFTNIDNAIEILETGYLYPRSEANRKGLMTNDNASSIIIDHTDTEWINYVRLYFRPRTPTQWQNEGYRPKQQRYHDAHCPVPIFFLFDSKKLLTRKNVMFSNASLPRSNSEVYSKAEDFVKLPFMYIYHDSYLSDEEKDYIIGARQAEVIVPEKLDLNDLKYIWLLSCILMSVFSGGKIARSTSAEIM